MFTKKTLAVKFHAYANVADFASYCGRHGVAMYFGKKSLNVLAAQIIEDRINELTTQ
jgi:hypothetical protein